MLGVQSMGSETGYVLIFLLTPSIEKTSRKYLSTSQTGFTLCREYVMDIISLLL